MAILMIDGAAMRARREAVGLSRADLAHRIGVTEETLLRWEKNANAPRKPAADAWNRELADAEAKQ
jgi:DNA-binding transcriptional regulator YiaG